MKKTSIISGSKLLLIATIISLPYSGITQILEAICYDHLPSAFKNEAAANGSDGNYIYLWQDSVSGSNWSAAPGLNADTAYQAENLIETTYFRRMVKAPNCGDSAFSNEIAVFVYPELKPDFTSVSNVNCPNDSNGNIILAMQGGAGNNSFLWNTGDTASTLESLTEGQYVVTITDQVGCTFIDSFNIGVNNVNPALAFISDTITLWSSAEIGVPGTFASYFWSTGSTDSSIVIQSSGSYALTVTNSAGCQASDTVYLMLALGIDEEKTALGLNIFPNPARNEINVLFEDKSQAEKLLLFDMTGRIVETTLNTNRLNVQQLPSGTYLLKVFIKGNAINHRVVIQ